MKVNLVKNKSNGQLNISLPKRDLPKNLIKELDNIKELEIKIEKWF